MSSPSRQRQVLFSCTSIANGGLVFATPERALEVDGLHRALSESRTWGEFQAAMPPDEYERIAAELFDDFDKERPAAQERFSSDVVPGFCDGDYPPWLQAELDRVLPRDVIKRWGRWIESSINGWYVHFDPADRREIVAMLESAGFDVVKREDLAFW